MFKEDANQLFARSEDDEMEKNLENFVYDNNFTADQLKAAYYKLLGISETSETDPAVEKIYAMLQDMTGKGLPLNRVAQLIGLAQNVEDTKKDVIPNYMKYVDFLNVSDKEKNILRSIVTEGWTGEVSLIVDGDVLMEFKMVKKDDISKELLAVEAREFLKEVIKRVPDGKKYGFMFIAD